MRNIVVYCGANMGLDPVYAVGARDFASELVSQNIGLVYGGGNRGLMGLIATAVVASGGKVTAVIPEHINNMGAGYVDGCEFHLVADMHARKKKMADLADAAVALPGGYGTLEEIFEFLTWTQLKIHRKPCGLLNTANYYNDLIRFLYRSSVEGFIPFDNLGLLTIEDQPNKLIEALRRRL
ncbi:MAG: TIGR00730 family Rossman fold protein [Candidatus Doudnabacteria bacterium]|nr:TIGR00730 family Rossman fold protein [Candidatus Doudnabacteria bacterium]